MKNIIIALVVFMALGNAATAQDTTVKSFGNAEKTVKKQLNKVLYAYYDLKDALVAPNATDAQKTAQAFVKSFDGVDTTKLTAEQKKYYQNNAKFIITKLGIISTKTDVKAQRAAFDDVSDVMYALIKSFKANFQASYRQYCPMANNGQGAYWLSPEEEVLNPYYGSEMLHCGEVEEEL
jgi:hypothetical protein